MLKCCVQVQPTCYWGGQTAYIDQEFVLAIIKGNCVKNRSVKQVIYLILICNPRRRELHTCACFAFTIINHILNRTGCANCPCLELFSKSSNWTLRTAEGKCSFLENCSICLPFWTVVNSRHGVELSMCKVQSANSGGLSQSKGEFQKGEEVNASNTSYTV